MKKKNSRFRKRPAPVCSKSHRTARRAAGKQTSVQSEKRIRDLIEELNSLLQREPSKQWFMDTFADDPIPENAIGFYDAFYQTWETAQKSSKRLELDQDDREEIRRCTESGLKQFVGDYSQEQLDDIVMGKEVNLFLRNSITDGRLVACVRDPETGDILQLQRDGWHIKFYPEEWGFVLYNNVHPDDPLNPGPSDVMVRGKARPVFFLKDYFERWLKKTFEAQKRRGRKRGSGSFEKADQPLVQEMRPLVESGRSPDYVSKKFADRAVGAGTVDSKATRLAKRYRSLYPSERN